MRLNTTISLIVMIRMYLYVYVYVVVTVMTETTSRELSVILRENIKLSAQVHS